jgi:succinoglycan biosynthesis transport protein ExoP
MFGDRNNVLIEPPAPAAPISGLPGGQGPGDGEVHLLDRLSVLYRYRKIVITVVVVVMLAGVVQTMTTTPEYMAYATVQIDPDRNLPGVASAELVEENSTVMATQVQALRSKDLIRTIVGPDKLNLATIPEFNGEAATPTGLTGAFSSIRERIMRPVRGLFSNAEPEAAPASAEPQSADGARDAEDALVDRFLGHLGTEPVFDSRAINITFVSRDPVLAARAANELANAFINQNLERRKGGRDEAVTLIQAEVTKKDQEIQKTDADMLEFQRTKDATLLADPGQLTSQQFTAQAEYEQAEAIAAQRRRAYEAVKDVKFDDPAIDSLPDMYADRDVQQWRVELANRRAELETIVVAKDHPIYREALKKVTHAEAELERARTLVKERLRREVETADMLARIKQGTLRSMQDLRAQMGTKGIDYQAMVRYRESQATTLAELQLGLQQAQIQAGLIQNNVFLVDSAVAPADPFKPNASNNMLMALFVGIALAGALAFGLDYLDDTIKTPEDITRKLRIPFLGLVPSVRSDKQPVLSGPVPHDFGEAYRALRTSLVFTSGGESTRIITCTSAQPLEGKTTTACNLAMVLAFGGSRVLLIDADMRRPGVHKALKINNTVGLSHLLVGQARVREAIQRTSDPNFCVMTAGRTPPNPSELLSSERMKQLIANLKQGPFDWVVIDTPPVLAVTDAVILTPLVDGVTFVLGAEMTRRRLAERAVQMLMVSRPKVVGAVLNRVNFDRNKYYYSRYYGYQYKSYYGSSSTGSTAKA